MDRPDGESGQPRREAIRRIRLRAGAALLSMLLAVGLSVAVAAPASAAPGGSDSTTVDGPNGPMKLTVRPVKNLPLSGAHVRVSGSGFDANAELWIAVCQDDGLAPESLMHCLGGAIPDVNASSSWAVVTADGASRFPGPVTGTFSRSGDFDLTLQIPGAAGQDADCVADPCSVYTRSADSNDRSQDTRVPIRFEEPPATIPAPTTETMGADGSAVAPGSVAQASLAPGEDQSVTFAGFAPGEVIEVTLFSDPISLPSVQADDAGDVTIDFTVPEDLPLGEHLVQAIGAQSGRVGVASFTVAPAEETTTATTATTTDASTVAPTSLAAVIESSVDESSAELTSADTVGDDAASAPSTPESAVASVDDASVGDEPADDSGNAGLLWLLWVGLAVLLVGGGIALYALTRRAQRSRHAGAGAAPAPEPWQPVDDGSLLGQWQDAEPAPQSWASVGSVDPRPAGGYDPGPAGGYDPGPAGGYDPGPATEQWQPGFLDDVEAPETPTWTVLGTPNHPSDGSGPGGGVDERPDSARGRHHAE